jgi:hypothetical protein
MWLSGFALALVAPALSRERSGTALVIESALGAVSWDRS